MTQPWDRFPGLAWLIASGELTPLQVRKTAADVERWFREAPDKKLPPEHSVWGLVSVLSQIFRWTSAPPSQVWSAKKVLDWQAKAAFQLTGAIDEELRLYSPADLSDPALVRLTDLRDALQDFGPPPHSGPQLKDWHQLALLLAPHIKEAPLVAGHKRVGIKPGSPLVDLLVNALAEFFGKAPSHDTIADFLKRQRKKGAPKIVC